MPQLADPNFRRAVVLVIHHDAESTFGLILNREVELSVRDLCASLEFEWRGNSEAEVGWGGPVESNTGWLLYQDGLESEIDPDTEGVSRIAGDLCFASSLDVLRRLALRPPGDLRIFLGYAGWGQGQLEAELAQGAWVVAPFSADQSKEKLAEVVFDVPVHRIWEHVLHEMKIDPGTLISTTGVH